MPISEMNGISFLLIEFQGFVTNELSLKNEFFQVLIRYQKHSTDTE